MKCSRWNFLFLAAVIALFGLPVAASSVSFPSPEEFVTDAANIISSKNEELLESQLDVYEKESSTEIAVLTVPTLEGMEIEQYAEAVFAAWGIGKKQRDNGILLLVAPTERAVRIEVGYGLEGALTDLESGLIIRTILSPSFQNGDFDTGIFDGVGAIIEATRGEYEGIGSYDHATTRNDPKSIAFIILVFIIVLSPFLRQFIWSRALSRSIWPSAVIGGVIPFLVAQKFIIHGALIGLAFDLILSRLPALEGWRKSIPEKQKKTKKSYFHDRNNMGGGGFGGGGFGGGKSGGGGASGKW